MATRRGLPVYPSYSEVHRILAACENERDHMLISLLWNTGGRVSEVIQARAGDVTDHGIKLINLKQSVATQKHVFLNPDFLARLRDYTAGKHPGELIITHLNSSKSLSRQMAWKIVTTSGLRAGIVKKKFQQEELRAPWPHAYRHGNAVRMLEQGIPINAVQAQLGHADLKSTEIYARLTNEHVRKLVAGVKF